MPIYEYLCQKCGRKTEVIQNHSDPPPKKCPHCGGAVKKAFSAPAIQFKGSGFYITDYGKGDMGASTGDGSEKSVAEKGEKSEKTEKAEKTENAGKSEPASAAAGGGDGAEKGGKSSKKESGSSSSSKPSEKKKESRKPRD
ncbi:MAG: hypothetical protein LC796_11455 [Acidobacteria bacterium]|nr:hypothetical protein [Acidobacteriota bacterium]MCA1611786.1 hypothetical protein [Acidobacteriota bacterium]MCA1617442.1 hypothetical protein [Acidobacteriota bacterium]